jgi:hypothetical protein
MSECNPGIPITTRFAKWTLYTRNNRLRMAKAGFGLCLYCKEKVLLSNIIYNGSGTAICPVCHVECMLPGDVEVNEVWIEKYMKEKFGGLAE